MRILYGILMAVDVVMIVTAVMLGRFGLTAFMLAVVAFAAYSWRRFDD